MPRVKLGGDGPISTTSNFVGQLAKELKSQRKVGQPKVYEQEYKDGRLRVTVIWDAWEKQSFEERTAIILQAYTQDDKAIRQKIMLASGLTTPEATSAGMLPYEIVTALRKDDPVTLDECKASMIQVGASTLLDPDYPQLRFATQKEAEDTITELNSLLPGSEPVWCIRKDVGQVDDWLSR